MMNHSVNVATRTVTAGVLLKLATQFSWNMYAQNLDLRNYLNRMLILDSIFPDFLSSAAGSGPVLSA